jgi:hypothetical protein
MDFSLPLFHRPSGRRGFLVEDSGPYLVDETIGGGRSISGHRPGGYPGRMEDRYSCTAGDGSYNLVNYAFGLSRNRHQAHFATWIGRITYHGSSRYSAQSQPLI